MRAAERNTSGFLRRDRLRTSVALYGHAPRGLLARYLWWNLLLAAGWPRARLQAHSRVVFVCLGNVCRSPYAEVRARQTGLEALSCGLSVDVSVPSPAAAVEAAARRGVDLSPHRSRPIDELELDPNDLVLVMEPSMLGPTRKRVPAGSQVALLGACRRSGAAMPYIPDPHGLPDAVFSAVYDTIDRCVDGLARLCGVAGPR